MEPKVCMPLQTTNFNGKHCLLEVHLMDASNLQRVKVLGEGELQISLYSNFSFIHKDELSVAQTRICLAISNVSFAIL